MNCEAGELSPVVPLRDVQRIVVESLSGGQNVHRLRLLMI